MRSSTRLLAALSVGLGIVAAPAFASFEPPTDEQLAAAIERYQEETRANREDPEARYTIAADAFGSLDFTGMSMAQLKQLRRYGSVLPPEKAAQARARLDELARDPGAAGAAAALLRGDFLQQQRADADPEEAKALNEAYWNERAAAMLAVLRHPGLHDAIQGEDGGEVFSLMSLLRPADLAEARSEILAIERALQPGLPVRTVARAIGYFQVISAEDAGFEPADRERIRRRILSLADGALEELTDDEASANDRRALTRTRDFLAGAFARGQLVGHTAPQVDFLWSSTEEPLASLADLRGKVVVVDFWATWCGPCIGSFPQIRELTAHYAGYPVVVLGITSIQGSHFAHKPGERPERIDTKDDPEKEFALMRDFMRDMDVTWPVAFAKQEVFNPDFGVRGIPHVAIIDPAGKVRYRGLHPAMPRGRALHEKAEKIDGLLREFDLPTPAPPPEPAAESESPAAADR